MEPDTEIPNGLNLSEARPLTSFVVKEATKRLGLITKCKCSVSVCCLSVSVGSSGAPFRTDHGECDITKCKHSVSVSCLPVSVASGGAPFRTDHFECAGSGTITRPDDAAKASANPLSSTLMDTRGAEKPLYSPVEETSTFGRHYGRE